MGSAAAGGDRDQGQSEEEPRTHHSGNSTSGENVSRNTSTARPDKPETRCSPTHSSSRRPAAIPARLRSSTSATPRRSTRSCGRARRARRRASSRPRPLRGRRSRSAASATSPAARRCPGSTGSHATFSATTTSARASRRAPASGSECRFSTTTSASRRQAQRIDAERVAPALHAALGTLPAAQRRAVELRVLDELPYAEVGRSLGCSPLAARIKVSRALGALSRIMEGAVT